MSSEYSYSTSPRAWEVWATGPKPEVVVGLNGTIFTPFQSSTLLGTVERYYTVVGDLKFRARDVVLGNVVGIYSSRPAAKTGLIRHAIKAGLLPAQPKKES